MECANERYFTAAAKVRAADGIIDPQPTIVEKGLIFRYGSSVENAKTGGWWLDANQYQRVETWAAANKLSVPHAARILSGVLHEWGKTALLKSNMRVLVRAEVRKPLRAFSGLAKKQSTKDASGKVIEMMDSFADPKDGIVQLYIPGLAEPNLPYGTLAFGLPVVIGIGASHIFGVPGVPEGTSMN